LKRQRFGEDPKLSQLTALFFCQVYNKPLQSYCTKHKTCSVVKFQPQYYI